jgi:hypothetical protein
MAALVARLEKLAIEAPKELGAAMYQEGLVIQGVSMSRTPVEFGALRASHATQRPDFSGSDPSVQITVGGPSAPYAVYVHENLAAHHHVGQAKFLESAIKEAAPTFAASVARRFDLNRAARS